MKTYRIKSKSIQKLIKSQELTLPEYLCFPERSTFTFALNNEWPVVKEK